MIQLFLLFSILLSGPQLLAEEWRYSVQPGDNLWNLSKRYLASMQYWRKLQELNNIEDPVHIAPGTTLRFPLEWLKSGSSVAVVVALSGEVEVIERGSGQRRSAQPDMIVWENDTILTGAKGSVTLKFVDGSTLLLQGNSELTLETVFGYGATGMAKTKVRLKKGRTDNKVKPKTGPGSRFEISTPSAIAAVRGTEYRISSELNGESRAEVLQGGVGVTSGAISQLVPAGFGMIARRDTPPGPQLQLLASPELGAFPARIVSVPFHHNLEPLEGAAGYRVQIAGNSSFESLFMDKTFPSEQIWGPDLPDGEYYIRIRGIDQNGLEGFDTVQSFVMDARPLPPLQIKPAAGALITSSEVQFQWSEPLGISSYTFQLASDEHFDNILIDSQDITETSYSPELQLQPGDYYWRVATKDKKGEVGPFSDHQQFRRSPETPDISASELDTSEMVFRWREGAGIAKYRCQIASDEKFSTIVADGVVTEPHYSFSDLSYGTYFIRIAAIDTDGYQGPFSPPQKAHIPSPRWIAWLMAAPIFLLILL